MTGDVFLPNLPAGDSVAIREAFGRVDRLTSKLIAGPDNQIWYDPQDANGVRSLVMSWAGVWQPGKTYYPGQVVFDDGWVMTPNTPTTDRPAPQPTGDPRWVGGYSDPPVEFQQANLTGANSTNRGQRYTFNESGFLLSARGYNIVADPDVEHTLAYHANPGDPGAIASQLAVWRSTKVGWVTLPLGQIIVMAGLVLDLWLNIVNRGAAYAEETYQYDYQTPAQITPPVSGVISHSDRELNMMHVHYTDNGGTDRTAFLSTLQVGDEVTDGVVNWIINQITDQGTYLSLGITPTAQTVDGVGSFTFRHYSPATIPIGSAVDHFAAQTSVRSIRSNDGEPWVIADHGFQVDLQLQNATVSDDWDAISYSG